MRTPVKLAAFGAALAAVFAGAFGVGAAAGSPVDPAPRPSAHGHSEAGGAHGGAVEMPAGLLVADRGYTLQLDRTVLPAGARADLTFRVATDDGRPLRDYTVSHDRRLHLVLVRRDTAGFRHVHPELSPDGTWHVPVSLAPGDWRVFADFVPAAGPSPGEPLTLGADLSVAGPYRPRPLPAASRIAEVDGYRVTLDGDLRVSRDSVLTVTVTRDGEPVTDLQPYLGAYGHLVALRAGDLAYLHVHPDGEPGDGATAAGPGVTFHATAPSAASYRLYLEFRHGARVHTAEFTVEGAR